MRKHRISGIRKPPSFHTNSELIPYEFFVKTAKTVKREMINSFMKEKGQKSNLAYTEDLLSHSLLTESIKKYPQWLVLLNQWRKEQARSLWEE